jgi:hypothetical protein
MFTNKVNAASFGFGKGKRVTLIKRVILMPEFEEALESHALLKVSHSGQEKCEL